MLMTNNEIVMDLLQTGDYERTKIRDRPDDLDAAKVYGVKAVNPGGVTAWKWGKDAVPVHEPVVGCNKVDPGVIVSNLARI